MILTVEAETQLVIQTGREGVVLGQSYEIGIGRRGGEECSRKSAGIDGTRPVENKTAAQSIDVRDIVVDGRDGKFLIEVIGQRGRYQANGNLHRPAGTRSEYAGSLAFIAAWTGSNQDGRSARQR